jgi:hypothetical protein
MRYFDISVYAVLGLLLITPVPGTANDKIIGDQLSGDVALTEKERASLEPELARYCALEGSSESLKALIQCYAKNDCRDECMADLLGLVNSRIKEGLASEVAANEVMTALGSVREYSRSRGLKPAPQEISRAVRANIEKNSGKSAPKESDSSSSPMVR